MPAQGHRFAGGEAVQLAVDNLAQALQIIAAGLAVQMQGLFVRAQLAGAERKTDDPVVVVELCFQLVAEMAAEFFQIQGSLAGGGESVGMFRGSKSCVSS